MFPRVDFSCQTEEITDGLHVRLQGEIDLSTAPRLRDCLQEAIGRNRHIIVDLTDVDFLDLKGIQALEEAHRASRAQKRHLVVVGSAPIVERVIQITGLPKIVPVVHSREEALKFIRGVDAGGGY